MATQLIELEDGSLIEVDAAGPVDQQVAFGQPDRINSNIKKIKPLIQRAINPLVETMREIGETTTVDSAEIELGLSFEAEGNIYITKAKGGANLKVKIKILPPAK